MEFGFTPEQEAIREMAQRFAADKLAPYYAAREKAAMIDPDLLKEMGGLGLIAPDLPESCGGMGVDGITNGALTEAIAYGDFNVSYVQLLCSLIGTIIAEYARPELAGDYLKKVTAGEMLLCLCLTEPQSGTDAAHLRLKAERSGDHYILNGEKASISFATQAGLAVVFARTGTDSDGARGVSAFLVPMDLPGLSTSAYDDLGSLAVGRGSIWFDNVKIPADHLLGEENRGFSQVMRGFDYSRALIGLQCVGAARASLDETWPHTAERQAFGRPLAEFQGVTFPLAEAETAISAAQLLCYRTLWLRDQGQPHTAEAAMAKWYAPKVAVDAVHQCLLSHGHMGYSKDMPHQQRLRDIIGLEIGDGTAQVSKLVIAREKVGRIALQYASPKKK